MAKGKSGGGGGRGGSKGWTQADLDNRSNQLNPNNEAYYSSRREDPPENLPSGPKEEGK